MNPRIGSLFSGYGGTDMAVLAALGGGEVVWHSDIKPASVALLAHRHPDVPNLGDMTRLWPAIGPLRREATEIEPVDALVASWPCQPHSSAGKRLGEADPRALWPNVARAIAETRPAIFFGENVARITGNGELRRVVRSLARLGYVGAWRVLSAADRGACHLRNRCFVVAVDPAAAHAPRLGNPNLPLGGDGGPLPIGTVTGPSAGDRAGHPAPGVRQLGRAAGGVDSGPRLTEVHPTAGGLSLLPTPKATDGEKGGPGMRGRKGDLFLPSVAVQLLPSPTVGDARNTRNATAQRSPGQEHHHSGWTLSDVAHADRWGVYAEAIARHEVALGRPAPEPTQVGLTNGNPQLSARFVEWMMMLPEGWVTDVPDLVDSPRKSERNAMLSLLGDGVVPTQGAAAFRFLLDHLAERLAEGVAA